MFLILWKNLVIENVVENEEVLSLAEKYIDLGVKAFVKELGNVDAERFINLAIKDKFDYTEWRKKNIHEDISLRELSNKAMKVSNKY